MSEQPPWVDHPHVALPLRASDGSSRWEEAVQFAQIRADARGIRQTVRRKDINDASWWSVRDALASVGVRRG